MPLSSAQISQAMAAQTSMFSGQMALSHQLAYQGQVARHPGMTPPSPAGPMNYGGMAQNALTGGANFMGSTAMPFLGAGLGVAGGMGMLGAASPLFDPFGAMMMGGRAGFTAMGGGGMGLAGGAIGAAAGFLPFYAAGALGSAYTGAAYQGMQSQGMVNNMLGQNFNFAGGAGPMGRGFNMGQMGMIGGVLNQAARQDPFTSMSELTGITGMGAQSGMFTAVRDVQEFTQKFRQMLTTLKGVQDQLGGSLQEAMIFVNQSKQSGIFKAADRTQFSGLVRQTADITGLSRDRVMQMTSYGAQLTRSLGGTGAQGAVGATLALQQLGAAVQTGAVSEELLSEATGGLTGDDAMMAFSQRMMQRAGRLTRRGFGRYSIFGLANEEGTGIDSSKMARFLSGDMSMGEIGRSAYAAVGRMGRPRAMRNEGLLRASAVQQGGLAFEAGKMRAILGDRIMSQGDDVVQAVMQRRFRMNRAEATAMTAMIRNLPEIATTMAIEGEQSDIDRRRTDFMSENQSFESVRRRIGTAVNEGLGIADAREWGRRLFATVGSKVEEFTNDLFGIARQEFSQVGRQRMRRVMMGRGTAEDLDALARSGGGTFNAAAQLTTGLLQGGSSDGQLLQAAGFDVASMSGADYARASAAYNLAAKEGVVTGASSAALDAMNSNGDATVNLLAKAAQQGGSRAALAYIRDQGSDPVAALAFAKSRGIDFGQGGRLSGVLQSGMSLMDRYLGLWNGTGPSAAAQTIEDVLDDEKVKRAIASGSRRWSVTGIQNEDLESAFALNPALREAAKKFALTPGDLSGGLSAMRSAAMTGSMSEDQRQSTLEMIDEIEGKVNRGEDITQLATALGTLSVSSPQDQANMRAQAIAVERMRMRYGTMGAALSGTAVGEALTRVSDTGDFTGIRDAQMALAGMSSVDRAAALSSLGDSPEAIGLSQGAYALSRQRRELRGGGRQGQLGARNAMFSMYGGIASGLEVEVDGRLVRGNTQRMLSAGLRGRGGRRGTAAVDAARSRYLEMGFSEEETQSVLLQMSSALADGRITESEAIEMQKSLSPEMQQVFSKEERSRRRMQDPLDSDRNDHLAKLVKANEASELYLRGIFDASGGTEEKLTQIRNELADKNTGVNMSEAQ